MLAIILFIVAVLFSVGHIAYKKVNGLSSMAHVFLGYVLFFNMGIMGLLAAYAHIFKGPETAKLIGWEPGSPFQFEVGIANLSYGVLGLLAFWIRGRFWDAGCLGWSVFLLGCFVGHIINYYTYGNTAPFNIGVYVWFNDLFLPILVLTILGFLHLSFAKEKRKI